MKSSTLLASVSTLAAATLARAQVNKQCPKSDICYSLNIPDATSSSGNGDIYFQITAPTKYQWIGLGQGQAMAGSNMFLLYTDSTGNNVTVSPRLGVGEVEPDHDTATQITLLEGTGVQNNMMVANVKCSNCNSWKGGTMDFADQKTDWIYAYKTGRALNTDALDADLDQHDAFGYVSFEKAAAQGGSSANPFVVAAAGSGNANAAATAAATNTDAGAVSSPTADPAYSASGSDGTFTGTQSGVPFGGDFNKAKAVQMAHGIMASLAFVVFFPVGGIIIRVFKVGNPVIIHAATQAIGWTLFVAAFGLGCYLASELSLWGSHHPIIGIVLFALILLQPLLGLLHHWMFKKYARRQIWSYAHIWLGRFAIVLGIINGGLGLDLAGNASNGALAAYGVVAGVFGLAYVAAIIIGEMERKKRQRSGVSGAGEKELAATPSPPNQEAGGYYAGSEEKITGR